MTLDCVVSRFGSVSEPQALLIGREIGHETIVPSIDNQLSEVFDESGIGMALISPNGQMRRVNTSFSALLGFEAEALEGQNLLSLIDPKDCGLVSDALAIWKPGERFAAQVDARVKDIGQQSLCKSINFLPKQRPKGTGWPWRTSRTSPTIN